MRIGGRFMAVIGTVLATVAIGYGAVSAHHADVDVKTTCTNDGGYDYVITLSPPDNWGNPTWTLNNDVTQDSNTPFVIHGHALISDGTTQVPEYIVWTNGASWSATVEVTAPVNCVVVTTTGVPTTISPTTVAPTTQAPTTVVETTVPATGPATTAAPGESTTTTVKGSDSPTGTTTTVATSQGLPSTGGGNAVMYLAMIVLGLGTLVVCVTRRSAVN